MKFPFLSFKNSSKGFSMVGVLMMAGLMGGLSVLLVQMTRNQMVVRKKMETNVELAALEEKVLGVFQNVESCKNTLGVGSAVTAGRILTELQNAGGTVVLRTGSVTGNRLLQVDSMVLGTPTGSGSTREVDVNVVYRKLNKAITGQNTITKKIRLRVELNGVGTLLTCYAKLDALARNIGLAFKEELCGEIGGIWNTGTKKCSLPNILANKQCPPGMVLARFDSSGGMVCEGPGNTQCSAGPPREYITGFDGSAAPICQLRTVSPTCANRTNAQIEAAIGTNFPAGNIQTFIGGDSITTCAARGAVSKDVRCLGLFPDYSDFTPLGCCHTGGILSGDTANECASANLERRYCRRGVTLCPTCTTSTNLEIGRGIGNLNYPTGILGGGSSCAARTADALQQACNAGVAFAATFTPVGCCYAGANFISSSNECAAAPGFGAPRERYCIIGVAPAVCP